MWFACFPDWQAVLFLYLGRPGGFRWMRPAKKIRNLAPSSVFLTTKAP
jgi:hypothetical protein